MVNVPVVLPARFERVPGAGRRPTSPTTWDAFRFNFKRVFQIHTRRLRRRGARRCLKQHDVAVIVTDQRMPKMTGLEVLKAARSVRPDATGIILTGRSPHGRCPHRIDQPRATSTATSPSRGTPRK